MKFNKWTTRVLNVDLETGEILPNWNKEDYILINKTKNYKYEHFENRQTGEGHTKGIVTITNKLRKVPRQGKLY